MEPWLSYVHASSARKREEKEEKEKKGVGAKDLRDEALGESSVQPSSAPRELVSTGNRWQRLACS